MAALACKNGVGAWESVFWVFPLSVLVQIAHAQACYDGGEMKWLNVNDVDILETLKMMQEK